MGLTEAELVLSELRLPVLLTSMSYSCVLVQNSCLLSGPEQGSDLYAAYCMPGVSASEVAAEDN
jgi:hypothetical protein